MIRIVPADSDQAWMNFRTRPRPYSKATNHILVHKTINMDVTDVNKMEGDALCAPTLAVTLYGFQHQLRSHLPVERERNYFIITKTMVIAKLLQPIGQVFAAFEAGNNVKRFFHMYSLAGGLQNVTALI